MKKTIPKVYLLTLTTLVLLLVFLTSYFLFSISVIKSVEKGVRIGYTADGEYKDEYSKYIDRVAFQKMNKGLNGNYNPRFANVIKDFKLQHGFVKLEGRKATIWTIYSYKIINPQNKEVVMDLPENPIVIFAEKKEGIWRVIDTGPEYIEYIWWESYVKMLP